MKPGSNRDELCYPFIYETAHLCDFEVVTDELCGHIGAAFSLLPESQTTMRDIAADLDRVQPLAFHLNGSVRGRLAVEEADLAWLQSRLAHYRAEVGGGPNGRNGRNGGAAGFVLPRGQAPVPQLHQARSAAKRPFARWCAWNRRGARCR